ncbi:hypothetical protein Pst134EA_001013 [Puccinia striiformis f. sp. tritici]|uniref:hypothetical protein n=1 Tax=Puccinia striiformis f. sp. tritici TaxID=168172 RepID=UPI0020088766|nr:hypothetical protein Pst134EA_001013 [Puccinia striiformis f. sp. tritici]KAH9467202.1 hypothetical protein Pst134EB_002225 [Puccinia striiformis f. sp. tritici]KAH9473957.1 hypothetical protein Pst134EA_001013 [Puccinia striiformis f. sp. tritici]
MKRTWNRGYDIPELSNPKFNLTETHCELAVSIILKLLLQSKPDTMCIFCAVSAIVIVHKIYLSRKLALVERRIANAEQQKADAERRMADAEQQKADAEQQKADAEQQKADAEQQKADAEQQKADAEQQKADAEARYERWKDAEEQRMKRYERKIDDILLTQRFLDLKNQLNVMQSRTQKAPFTITPFI